MNYVIFDFSKMLLQLHLKYRLRISYVNIWFHVACSWNFIAACFNMHYLEFIVLVVSSCRAS